METSKAGGWRLPRMISTRSTSWAARGRKGRAGAFFPGLWGAGLVALAIGVSAVRADAFVMEPLDHGLVAVTMTRSGENEDVVKQDASLEAVRACVGRIFWGPDLLIAEDLLSSYLQKNHAQFVNAIEVLDTDFLAGRPQLTLRVFVNNRALQTDLRQKRFVIKPRPRPFFKVFLAEKLGNQFATYTTGQEALTAALQDRNLQPFEGVIDRPPTNIDVVADPILLNDALVACERNDIEILISGTSSTTRDNVREMYYDTYYFYTTLMDVALVRVDTGEVLARSEARGTASHIDEQRAIELSIRRAAGRITNDLADYYDRVWGPMVLNRAEYTLLLTGITDETLSLIRNALEGFSREANVYLRQRYDRTAVLNVVFPGERSELIKTISSHPYPTLRIIPPTEVDARLTGDSATRLVQKVDITKTPVDAQAQAPRIFNYQYETRTTLKLIDLRTNGGVVQVTATGTADGLDPQATALDSWRNALGNALALLNKDFPTNIEVVNLKEAVYTLIFPKAEKPLAEYVADQLRIDSPQLGKVQVHTREGSPAVQISYTAPAAQESNLLGQAPFLPDETLTAAARRNYLEIQVGE
jgi:hypothetical protein